MLQELKSGEKLRGIPADTWNQFVKVARQILGEAFDGLSDPNAAPGENGVVVGVKNSTSTRWPRFSVVGLSTSIPTTTYRPDDWRNTNVFLAQNPVVAAPSAGKFAILQKDLGENEVGPAIVLGVTSVKINVTDATHQFAQIVDGQRGYLRSAPRGPCRILWKETGTGDKWAKVLIDHGDWRDGIEGLAELVYCDPATTSRYGASNSYPLPKSTTTVQIRTIQNLAAGPTWLNNGYEYVYNPTRYKYVGESAPIKMVDGQWIIQPRPKFTKGSFGTSTALGAGTYVSNQIYLGTAGAGYELAIPTPGLYNVRLTTTVLWGDFTTGTDFSTEVYLKHSDGTELDRSIVDFPFPTYAGPPATPPKTEKRCTHHLTAVGVELAAGSVYGTCVAPNVARKTSITSISLELLDG